VPGVSAASDHPHVRPIPTRRPDSEVHGHVNNVEYDAFFDTVINAWLVAEGGLDIPPAAP
jgi:acyl-CoA thioester hydrolase